MASTKPKSTQLPGWTPFQPAGIDPLPSDAEIARMAKLAKVPFHEMKNVMEDIQKDTVYLNSRYQVNLRLYESVGFPKVFQLSIKRRDKQRIGPERYRDILRIKNELVGPMHEAFEIYPGMERNVDTANQYYVWCFADPSVRFPIGFKEGRMSVPADGYDKSVNHPFDEGDMQWASLCKLQHKGL